MKVIHIENSGSSWTNELRTVGPETAIAGGQRRGTQPSKPSGSRLWHRKTSCCSIRYKNTIESGADFGFWRFQISLELTELDGITRSNYKPATLDNCPSVESNDWIESSSHDFSGPRSESPSTNFERVHCMLAFFLLSSSPLEAQIPCHRGCTFV